MRNGVSVSPSGVQRAGRLARRSATRKVVTIRVTVVAATRPVATAGAGRTRLVATAAAVVVTPLAAVVTPAARARCIRRFAPSVAGTRKSRSSHGRTSRFIAGSASSCVARRCLLGITTTRTGNNAVSGTGAATKPPLFVLTGVAQTPCSRYPAPRSHLPGVAPVWTPFSRDARAIDPDVTHSR